MGEESLDQWFKREILVHEDSLMRFLARVWPHTADLTDLRQDTYVRVYEAAMRARPSSPKSFLFTTARHLMTDRFRRQRIVSIIAVGDVEVLNVLVEEISPERRTSAHQELRRLAHAFEELPPKCREAVWLRRVDDLPQREVASRMGVTQKTVEKHVMKGMRLLADALNGAHERADAEEGTGGRATPAPGHGRP